MGIISLKNKDKLFYHFAFWKYSFGLPICSKAYEKYFHYKVKTALLSKVLVLWYLFLIQIKKSSNDLLYYLLNKKITFIFTLTTTLSCTVKFVHVWILCNCFLCVLLKLAYTKYIPNCLLTTVTTMHPPFQIKLIKE